MHAGRTLIVLALGGVYLAMSWSSGHAQGLCFDAAVNYAAGNIPTRFVAADLDGDGDVDLAVANNWYDSDLGCGGVSILMNNGDGSFAAPVKYAAGCAPISVFAADLDGDGDLDLAAANPGDDNVLVLLNSGTGSFAAPAQYAVGSFPISVFAADLDGDGDCDLAVANAGTDNVSILKNNGDGTFATAVYYSAGSAPWSVCAADLDGNGYADLAVANDSSHNVSIFMNDGDGTFGSAADYPAGSNPFSILATDLDGDGDLDLAVANAGSDNVTVLKNSGTGSFAASENWAAGSSPTSVCAADLDGDSDLDLAVSNGLVDGSITSGNVSVLKNNGTGSFAAPESYAAGSNPFCVLAADLDGDGDLDLAVANGHSHNVSVLRNCTDVSTVVGDADQSASPKTFTLAQNYPNPFNAATQIRFVVPRYERVTLAVYDVLGRVVARLLDQEMDPGAKSIAWDGRDMRGRSVCSGAYFYRLTTSRTSETKKMVLLK